MFENLRWALIYVLLVLAMKLTRASDEKTALLLNGLAALFDINPRDIERTITKKA